MPHEDPEYMALIQLQERDQEQEDEHDAAIDAMDRAAEKAGAEIVRLTKRAAVLEAGLRLIVLESRRFPDEDGIGAGDMARNLLGIDAA